MVRRSLPNPRYVHASYTKKLLSFLFNYRGYPYLDDTVVISGYISAPPTTNITIDVIQKILIFIVIVIICIHITFAPIIDNDIYIYEDRQQTEFLPLDFR